MMTLGQVLGTNTQAGRLNIILSELEGETAIDANLLMENAECKAAIRALLNGKMTSTQVIEVINNQF